MTLTAQPPTNFIEVIPVSTITSGAAALRIGSSYIWVDAAGDLRISGAIPTGDLNGTVVGNQT